MGSPTTIVLVGPGRAGSALALRLTGSGHRVVGVLARDPGDAEEAARRLGSRALSWDDPLPGADLVLVAVRDDAIGEVAGRLAPQAGAVGAAVHVSGLAPLAALGAFRPGKPVGSFHPLQTLPTPEAGAARLEGAWVAVTSDDDALADRLFALAASIGARPFELADEVKPLYHAAAVAAANVPLAALEMARRLFEAAGVPFSAAGPLVEAVVANAFALGPSGALTGPITRGDVVTVASQRAAVEAAVPEMVEDFCAFGRAVARMAGREAQFAEVLG